MRRSRSGWRRAGGAPAGPPLAGRFPGGLFLGGPLLGGCTGVQAVLAPAGTDAAAIAPLSWLLFGGGTLITVLVVVLGVWALSGSAAARRRLARESTVVLGGIVLPVVTLSALLVHGLRTTSALVPIGPPAQVIEVIGEQWWWRVHYLDADGNVLFATANELRLPVGEPVDLRLTTNDVIHSFWVPRLAGKVDMIPGRVNRLRLRATEAGAFRGQCAEFCGSAHAMMAFLVVAEPPAAFAAWRARQAAPAVAPDTAFLRAGHDAFFAAGCGACHTVRGTPAAGVLGPDLTHVGSRRFIAAGTLRTSAGTLAGWIASSQHLKPDNRMPAFPVFAGEELRALAAWLEALG